MLKNIKCNIISDIKADIDLEFVYCEEDYKCVPSVIELPGNSKYIMYSAVPRGCNVVLETIPLLTPQPVKMGNNILVVNVPFANNYGHILHDVIPKLLMLDSQKKYCKIITGNSLLLKRIIETLQIQFSDKLVFIDDKLNFNCDQLTYRSDPAFHIRDINSTRLFKKHIEKFIQNNIQTTKRNRLIYYKRNGKDVCHNRLMDSQNENDIIELLKHYADQNGLEFTLFNGLKNGKTMSHIEQIQLFREAKVVVGAHGSGLANTVWMDPANDCRVCEFTSGTDIQVWGRIFDKNYNSLYGNMLSDYIDYNLIPFTKESTKDITHININNLKKFLT